MCVFPRALMLLYKCERLRGLKTSWYSTRVDSHNNLMRGTKSPQYLLQFYRKYIIFDLEKIQNVKGSCINLGIQMQEPFRS